MKQDGWTIGLYDQKEEQDLIEISRPGFLRAVKQFEDQMDRNLEDKVTEHAESSKAEQKKNQQLDSLLNLVSEDKIINPFGENGPHLVTLDTGEIMDPEVTKSLCDIEKRMKV